MPFLTGDSGGLLVRLNRQDFGMPLEEPQGRGMDVEPTEVPRESLLLFWGQLLVAEENNQIVEERLPDLRKLLIPEPSGKVDPFESASIAGLSLRIDKAISLTLIALFRYPPPILRTSKFILEGLPPDH